VSVREQVSFAGTGVRLVGDRWDPPAGDPRGIVLLLHGGGQTRHSWHRTGQRLAGEGWTAIALDARGHGESDWAPDGDYSGDALAGDLSAVIAELGEAPVLVGASMGGITALLAQGENPDLGRALVLVDITPRVEQAGIDKIFTFMTSAQDGFASLEEAAAAVRAYNPHRRQTGSVEGLRKNLRERDGRWYWHWDPAFLKINDEPRRDLGPDGPDGSDGSDGSDRPAPARSSPEAGDPLERLRVAASHLTCPTLLVRGRQSDIVSDEGVAELRRLVPQAQYADVTGAGHMIAGDDNDVFTATLGTFLESLPPLAN
jgi:pimeloyl-ACP methyl ester carboxylesterase